LNIANGYYGYVPALSDYENDNYEVQVSLLEAGCLEKLIDAVENSLLGEKSNSSNGVPSPHCTSLNSAPVATHL
jgi:hypothetical protein